ncbi:MAG: GspH/FimT family pseudopilin [Rhizobacter sp.]|nr:GspH/FimT family pseudopilin [Rhizobacter sp.]
MKTKSFARASAHGFTLVEMVAVVAVAGVITTAAVPSFNGLVDAQRISGTASELANDLQYARFEAVQRNQGVRVTFKADAACYVIHTGSANQCQCGSAGPAVCESGAQAIKTVTVGAAQGIAVQANVSSVFFDPVHGTASPAATLRVTGPQGRSVQHTVNIMGRVRSCSPQSSVLGYRAC